MTIPTLPGKVQAGDLITSDFMDKIIDVCEDLQERVSKLETPSQTSSMSITALLPSGTKHIGDALYIIGKGFDVPQGDSVVIDGIPVGASPGADKDKELVVTIPNVQGVTAAGKNVTLLVSNTKGTDSQDFIVFPAVATKPEGQIFVNYTLAPNVPALLSPSNNIFVYTVQALTDLDEKYVVKAEVSSGWSWQFVDTNGNPLAAPGTSIEIPLRSAPAPAGDTQILGVKVTIPGNLANTTAGTLRVTVTSKLNPERLNGHSGGETLTVGAAPPSPYPIAVTLNGVTRFSNTQPAPTTDADGRVNIGAGTTDNYRFNFGASIKANTVYAVQLTKPTDTKWQASLSASADLTSQNIGPVSSDTSQPIFVFLRASATAPDTTFTLRLTSTTDANQIGQTIQLIGLL